MSHIQTKSPKREQTPVDDVRRVREQLDREAGGDIHTLARRSKKVLEQYRKKLNLKTAPPPSGSSAAILELMRSSPRTASEEVDALERAIDEGKLPPRQGGIFDDYDG